VTPSAVIQVKPGIGDVIWHLPFIRAIAATSPGAHVTFLAPPSSRAKELLAAEPSVAETIYFEHSGSELRRGLNMIRLVALLRRCRFRTVWILDRTTRPACAALLAGIPERIGLGLGAQKHFISNPGVDHSHFHDHPIGWLTALMAAMAVPLQSTEPELPVSPALQKATAEKFGGLPRPWIVVGLGARALPRDWPDESWSEFVAGLRSRTQGTVFLTGSAHDAPRARRFIAQSAGAPVVDECGLPIGPTMALLAQADLYVGADSGLLNVAAAVGTKAIGIFGASAPLTYSRFIDAVLPDDGVTALDGMKRIAAHSVLARVEPCLAAIAGANSTAS
jgi:heptosyltransferase-2